MDSLKAPDPLSMDGNLSENWRRWEQRFDLYLKAMGAETKPDVQKRALLLHSIGEEAIEVYNTFTFADDGDDAETLPNLLVKFRAYCNPRKNVVYERYKFWQASQNTDQTFDQYVTDLKNLAKSCEFDNGKDLMIRDKIVFSTKQVPLKERLLRERDLTLVKAMDMSRAAETSREQLKTMQPEKEVHVVKHKKRVKDIPNIRSAQNKGRSQNLYPNNGSAADNNPTEKHVRIFQCRNCGTKHGRRACPAYGKSCSKCSFQGHYSQFCRGGSRYRSVHAVEDDAAMDDLFCDTITVDSISGQEEKDWIVPLTVNGSVLPLKLDTGAQANLMSMADFKQLKVKPHIHKTAEKLKGYYNTSIPVHGKSIMTVNHQGKIHKLAFHIVPGDAQALLGKAACERLGLIQLIGEVKTHSYKEIFKEYQDVFEGLGRIPGEHKIIIDKDVQPVVNACRKIPFPIHDKVKEELDRMEKLNVIVKVTEPTDWVNSLVVVPKKNGQIRLCMDPRDLNRAIKRQHYMIPTREEVMSKFAGAKYFSKLDASSGFWNIKLEDESSYLCTFNTPFGRYRYLRLPFGISSAPEVFHKAVHDMFESVEKAESSMDDIIIWGSTKEEHDTSLRATLDIARRNNLKLNRDKCVLGVSQLVFLGDQLSDEGIKPDDSKVSAIKNFPTPNNKQELQRFLGMITYLAKWVPDLSQKSAPLRALLEEKNMWQWGHEQEKALQLLKDIITSDPVLQFYDQKKPIRISTDASSHGLGAVVLQLNEDKWQPVAYSSRSLTTAEKNYAQIEKELLGIVSACERFHQFIYGKRIQIETDHKPLVNIFKKALNNCPIRVQRLLLRVQKYDLDVSYTPGKYLLVADALSRAHESNNVYSDNTTEDVVEAYIHMIMNTMPVSDAKMREIRQQTADDATMQALQDIILKGWPQAKSECSPAVQDYWNFREELSIAEGIILKGSKIVIPQSMRRLMLDKIHEGHLGIEKCRRRAREVIFWPRMNADIANIVDKCNSCLKYSKQQKPEPLQPHDIPVRAWQKVGTDLFEYKGKHFLVVADYYSLYPEVISLTSTTSNAVITAVKSIFARHGTPEVVMSDNGPQYSSQEFKNFSKQWDFEHITSSPHYAQSNGLAESSVKTVKTMLKKCLDSPDSDFYKALLAYRSTPLENGQSPAQMLMNRRIRSSLPIHPSMMSNDNNSSVVERKIEQKMKQKEYYDHGTRALSHLSSGDRVRIKDHQTNLWSQDATVVKAVTPHSYKVETDHGTTLRRNRRNLRKTSINTARNIPYIPENTPTSAETEDKENNISSTSYENSTCESNSTIVRRSSRPMKAPTRLIENM